MPERKHAAAPNAVLARPLSWASDPVATGRPRPGQPRPRARKSVIAKVNAPRSVKDSDRTADIAAYLKRATNGSRVLCDLHRGGIFSNFGIELMS